MKASLFRMVLVISMLLIFSVSCSQCGSTQSKDEYIKTLDDGCAKYKQKTKDRTNALRGSGLQIWI